jgi:hypothetical protein
MENMLVILLNSSEFLGVLPKFKKNEIVSSDSSDIDVFTVSNQTTAVAWFVPRSLPSNGSIRYNVFI